MPADKSRATLKEDTHFRVLRLLKENPTITQRELSERLGISLGAANYVLRALVAKSLIKIENFKRNPRKIAYAYFLTPQGLAEKSLLAARFLKRKREEFEAIKAEIEALSGELSDRDVQTESLAFSAHAPMTSKGSGVGLDAGAAGIETDPRDSLSSAPKSVPNTGI